MTAQKFPAAIVVTHGRRRHCEHEIDLTVASIIHHQLLV